MFSYRAKPPDARWQPEAAPAGCRGYWLAHEGAGLAVRDLARRSKDGAFIGAVAWQRGPYGPQLGGFSTANYASIDPPVQILGVTYPFWVAVLASNTATASAAAIGQGSTSSTTPQILLHWNRGGVAGTLAYVVVSDANVLAVASAASQPITDGLPRVAQGVSYATDDHRLYLDGVQVASSALAVGALTNNTLTLGALRRSTVSIPFGGSLVAAAVGHGAVPDPKALADDWRSGRFVAARPRRRLYSFAEPPAAFKPAWAAGSNTLIGGGAA